MNLLNEWSKNPFALAPMAGITDTGLRSFMRELGAGVVVTELVSATGLAFMSQKTRALMAFGKDQHPVGVQIFGENLEHLARAAQEIETMGADFVDLNFGCPVPKVVKKGAGSAVLKDLTVLRDVLRAVKSAVGIPVSIKVRTGWDQNSRNSDQVAQVAYDEGIAWMAIHGRTRAQGYEGKSDWDYIRWVKSLSKIPIIGNGDIVSAGQAVDRLHSSLCDGVLIGRGCLKNPWIFAEAKARYEGQVFSGEKNYAHLFRRLEFHLAQQSSPQVVGLQLKKFAAWFSAGYRDSAQFRRQLFQTQELPLIHQAIEQFYSCVQNEGQTDTSAERFLMGGHG